MGLSAGIRESASQSGEWLGIFLLPMTRHKRWSNICGLYSSRMYKIAFGTCDRPLLSVESGATTD